MAIVKAANLLRAVGYLCLALPFASQLPASSQELLLSQEASTGNVSLETALNPHGFNKNEELTLLEILQNLRLAGLLEGEAYRRTLNQVEQGVATRRSDLLRYVLNQFQLNLRDELGVSRATVVISIDDSEHIQTLLEQLNATGILTESTYKHLQTQLATGELASRERLLSEALVQTEREDALEPEIVQPRLEALTAAGIMSHEEYTALLEALEDSALRSPIEIFDYISQAQSFDLNDYPFEPERYFPLIHQDIADMLLQAGILRGQIGDFSLELVLDEEFTSIVSSFPEHSSLRFYDAVVSTQLNGHLYQHASDYSPIANNQELGLSIDSEQFVHLFNKILRDQESRYRLYTDNRFDPHYDPAQFSVVALTEAQAGVYWNGYNANHDSRFTSRRITEIITLLKDTGLLAHLSEAEVAEGETLIARSYITHPYEILSAFPNVVLLFDWESAGSENPYERFLRYFTRKLCSR